MRKTLKDRKSDASKKIEKLEIEISILRDAYFQLEKALQARKKAEEELQKSEERLSFLISSVPAVIYVSKAYGDYAATFISTNVKGQMGYKAEDFTSNPKFWVDHIHPDDRQRILKELSEIFKKGHHTHEYRFEHKDGSYRWMYDESRLIKDENGKPKEIIGYWADITERKKAEHDLGERMKELTIIYKTSKIMEGEDDLHKALSELVEAIPPAYQFPNLACARIIYNDRQYKSAGFKKTKWRQSTTIEIAGRKIGIMEVFYLEKKPFLVEEEKMIREVASQIGNISERKRTGKALKDSQESLVKAQQIAHLGNWDWNIVTNELWWSDEIYRIFGLKPQEFGATYDAFIEKVHPDDRDSVKNAISEALKKNNYSIDHRIVQPSGKVRIVHEQAEVTYDKSDKPVRMLGTVLDITELKKAEEELKVLTEELRKEKESIERKVVERTEELRETQKRELAMKDEFVFVATHDLSTPVTAVIGYLDFIKESKEKFSEDTQKSFKAIEEAAGRLEQLVEDLLQVARSESGTIKVKVSPVDVVELLEASIRQVSPFAKEKDVSIKSELDQNGKYVLADKEKLSEVIENLLSNAVKFNRDKGKIRVVSKRVDDRVQVDVADSGYGISRKEQGKVFQKFFRSRTEETEDIPGTGLGLFVVRMLIEKMKGNITFTSEQGKGTTFTFTLPVASKPS